jgi:hypothetical protein
MKMINLLRKFIGKFMPYKKVHENDKWCVYKEDADKNPVGDSLGCHDTEDEANAQMAALYAAMADEKKSFYVWKSANEQYQWIATYSNNIRDDDSPPEIISEKSHLSFIEKVEKGLVDYPELWLWHTPEWTIGKSTWLAWDTSGFAMAAGYFNKGCEEIAESLMKADDVRVSHGMPSSSVKRSKEDPTVITEHITKEISPLPGFAAANRWTGFIVMEDTMIDEAKKKALKDSFGIDENVIAKIEQLNEHQASKAKEIGLETKEVAPVVEPVVVGGELPKDAVIAEPDPVEVFVPAKVETPAIVEPIVAAPVIEPPAEVKQVAPQLTKEDVASVIDSMFKQLAGELSAKFGDIEAELSSLKKSDREKIATKAAETPRASLLATIQSMRAVGSDQTKMGRGERTDGPRETRPESSLPPVLQAIKDGKDWRKSV